MRRKPASLVALSALILLAACGSSSGSGSGSSEKDYVDQIVKAKNSSSFTKELNDSQMRCLGTKVVDAVGVDTLKNAHITPQKIAASNGLSSLKGTISTQQATKIVDAITSGECFDFTAFAVKESGSAALNKLTKAQASCMFNAIFAIPQVKSALADSLLNGSSPDLSSALSDQGRMQSILSTCKIDPTQLAG